MKQVLQNLKSGETILADVPCPGCGPNAMLVKTHYSLISPGTERMLLDFGKKGFIGKALDQPDRVKDVLNKARVDGLAATWSSVNHKLSDLLPMGYSNVGEVVEVSDHARSQGFKPGDMVLSNGYHAEMVNVPTNLCVKLPASDDYQKFTLGVLGAIALQGVRLADAKIGEKVAVFGAGLIGRLTIDILSAAGAEVYAIDMSDAALDLVKDKVAGCVNSGSVDVEDSIMSMTGGTGVDSVLITASAKTNDIISTSAKVCRKRGTVILVGVVGLNISRADFYEKEIKFQVSCSYGPGRYDPDYEEGGNDYPYGFVRWTQNRNMQAIVALIDQGKISLADYCDSVIDFDDVLSLYSEISGKGMAKNSVISYGASKASETQTERTEALLSKTVYQESTAEETSGTESAIGAGFLGTGAYASKILAGAARTNGFKILGSASRNGLSAWKFNQKHDGQISTSENQVLLSNEDIKFVFVATQHAQHASQVVDLLKAQKAIWCEKPLCLSLDQLEEISAEQARAKKNLYVGFNRRHSSHSKFAATELSKRTAPAVLTYNVNAGAIPADHWVNKLSAGGGRFIGENCHFIDLCCFLLGTEIVHKSVRHFKSHSALEISDNFVTMLQFADGSIATINYFTGGSSRLPKEVLSAHFEGKSLLMDNFLRSKIVGKGANRKHRTLRQDKGTEAMIKMVHQQESSGRFENFADSLDHFSMKTTLELDATLHAD